MKKAAILLRTSFFLMINLFGPSLPTTTKSYMWSLNYCSLLYFDKCFNLLSVVLPYNFSLMVKKHICCLLSLFFILPFPCRLDFHRVNWLTFILQMIDWVQACLLSRILVYFQTKSFLFYMDNINRLGATPGGDRVKKGVVFKKHVISPKQSSQTTNFWQNFELYPKLASQHFVSYIFVNYWNF